MPALFSNILLRQLEIKNRVWVSPMCQYSAQDGLVNEWHRVHYGARAIGGAGMVIFEATAVSPEGRITLHDLGLWNDAQQDALKPLAHFIRAQGAVAGIQLGHAGRKASAELPWQGRGALHEGKGAWQTLAPSPLSFSPDWPAPKEMTEADIQTVVAQFSAAAGRAIKAGFQVAEIHMAHGYLLHQFLSPLTNTRQDSYGGSFENRVRFPLAVAKAVREAWPQDMPVFVRISATDWVEGGWELEQSISLARALKDLGIDLIDCSTGGLVSYAKVPVGPGYQVPFAEAIRSQAGIATAAVGMITEAQQANNIVTQEKADAVLLARALLRDPHWPLQAAKELGAEVAWPVQYVRAKT